MKAIIEGKAYFPRGVNADDDEDDVPVEVLAAPDEELERGQILFVHKKFSLVLSRRELLAALRMFE
jgi:hypothetical protein